MKLLSLFTFLLFSTIGLFANHDEAVDGDLSDDWLNPTSITLVNGSNVISATSTAGDVEYFTITIPAGGTLNAINLTAFNSPGVAFLALQAGSTFSGPPSDFASPAALLGFNHLGLPLEDKLPILAASSAQGALGFSAPLPAGTYTFWAQETATGSSSSYTLDFVTTIPPTAGVPTMGEWGIGILALLMLIFTTVAIRSSVGFSLD